MLVKYRYFFFGTLLLLTLISLFSIQKIEVNQELDDYYPINNPDLQLHNYITEQLDDLDDFIVIALINDGSAFQAAFLDKVKVFTELCQKTDHVKNVYSLMNFKDYISTDFGPISYYYIEQSVSGSFIVDTNRIFKDPRTKDCYLSRDRTSQLVTIQLKPNCSPDLDLEIISMIESHLNEAKLFNNVIGGRPYYEVSYNRIIGKELTNAVLLCIGFTIILLFIIYKSIWAFILPLLVFIISLINILGLMVLFGLKVDGMTTLLPSIILVVSISDVVHILSKFEYYLKRGQSRRESLQSALNSAGLATFLTSFTTAVGFFVLAFSPIPILTHFSLEVAVGVLLAYAIAIVLLLVIVLSVKPESFFISPFISNFWNTVYYKIKKLLVRKGPYIETAAIITAISGITASFFMNTNHTLFSAVSSKELLNSVSYLDSQTGGARYFQLALFPQNNKQINDLDVLQEIDKIEAFLDSRPEISNIISPLTYYKSLNMSMNGGVLAAYKLPSTQNELDRQNKVLKGRIAAFSSSVFNEEKTIGRITASIPDLGRKNIKNINVKIEEWIDEFVDETLLTVRITGPSHMVDVVQETSIRNMIVGLLATFLVIAIIVAMVLKDFFYALLSFIVNILPLLATALAMVILDIELRFATSIIFTIGYVIAIDDTIHIILNFNAERKKSVSREKAIDSTIKHTGRAILLTTIILMSGFSVLMFSSFRDVQDIGVLTTLLLFFAVITDLFLCPKLILLRTK